MMNEARDCTIYFRSLMDYFLSACQHWRPKNNIHVLFDNAVSAAAVGVGVDGSEPGMKQLNAVHSFRFCFCKIHLNMIPLTPKSHK